MDESTIPQSILKDNMVDKAAASAGKAIDATKSATNAALDGAADKVEAMRSSLSPAVDDALDSVLSYTRDQPVNALLLAVGTGMLLSMMLRSSRR